MKILKPAILAALTLTSAGCQTFKEVRTGGPLIGDSALLIPKPDADTGLLGACPDADATDPAAIRKCTEAIRLLIDRRYFDYRHDLFALTTTGNTLADAAVSGLGVAGTLTAPGTTKVLSAIIAGVNGLKATADQDLLYKNSIALILLQMDKDRASWATVIQKNLNATTPGNAAAPTGYKTMNEAATDLYAYFVAGTWDDAILKMQSDAGAQAAQCDAEYKNAKLDQSGTQSATPTSICGDKPSSATTTPNESATALFASGETLSAKDVAAIQALAALFQKGGYASISVVGKADGGKTTAIATARADAAVKVLTDAGVKDDGTIVKTTFVDPNANKNARAVVVTLKKA